MKDINATKLGDRFRHHPLDVSFVRDVAFHEQGAAAFVRDQLSRFVTGLSVDIGDRHSRAFIGKSERASATDPLTRPGDDGYFAFKSFTHILHLFTFAIPLLQ